MTSKRAVKSHSNMKADGRTLNDSFKRLSFRTSNCFPSRRPTNARARLGCMQPSSNFIATEDNRESIRSTWNGFAGGEDDQMAHRVSEPRHHYSITVTEPPPLAPGLIRQSCLFQGVTRYPSLHSLVNHQRVVKVS